MDEQEFHTFGNHHFYPGYRLTAIGRHIQAEMV